MQEDDKIVELVKKYGPTKWSIIAKSLPGRIGKQCRERLSSGTSDHFIYQLNINIFGTQIQDPIFSFCAS